MKKEPIDPSKVKAYNHYPIDGNKPVISNQLFKEANDSQDIDFINSVMLEYALDITQKNLLNAKLINLK
jgi:hypothetical protein